LKEHVSFERLIDMTLLYRKRKMKKDERNDVFFRLAMLYTPSTLNIDLLPCPIH
jgi:hypothetical protein